MPNVKANIKYVSMNIPPPYFAASVGNRQRFPKPTALAAPARMNAHLPDHAERDGVPGFFSGAADVTADSVGIVLACFGIALPIPLSLALLNSSAFPFECIFDAMFHYAMISRLVKLRKRLPRLR